MFSPERRPLFLYFFAAFCFFLSAAWLFGPLLTLTTEDGETIAFFGFLLIFGGKAEYILPSGVYAYTFNLSVYLLVISQCFLLGGVSCLLGKRSRFNRVASVLLGAVGFGMTCFYPRVLCDLNTLSLNGANTGGAMYMILLFAALAMALEILYGIFAKPNPAKRR